MNSVGKFCEEEIDGKQYFVYYLDNSAEPTSKNEFSFQILFQCPGALFRLLDIGYEGTELLELHPNSRFYGLIQENEFLDDDNESLCSFDHPALPLHWCNNKNGNPYHHCGACPAKFKVGSDYYFCVHCNEMYHKECVESSVEIKHPFHLFHDLKLFLFEKDVSCVQCGKSGALVYHCTLCNVSMHPLCALKSIPLVIDQPKRHNHLLTFFTRKASLDCNVCSLINRMRPTYVCVKCDFVAHKDCANFPSVIRISRHHHRISFISSLSSERWSCGVCRKDVDSEYGAYTCNKCDGYVVHSRCALRKDIWDGKELEGIPEDDIEDVVKPFEKISDGIIRHFCHDHNLKLETSGEVYDGNKICDACVIPIYEGDFYSCVECDFILHDTCANAPRKIRHPLHPHPLALKVTSGCVSDCYFQCEVCRVICSGFRYECSIKGRPCFELDIRCGSISEPFDYQGHEHPLFLALDPQERKSCQVCQADNRTLINCMECDFIRCFECVTLPYMARYKYDKHFLKLGYWEEANEPDWCEICEKHIFARNDDDRRFYTCKQCCTTLHLKCLLGKNPYMKPGHTLNIRNNEVEILHNNSLSRPTCDECHGRCVDKIILKTHNNTFCSLSDALFFI